MDQVLANLSIVEEEQKDNSGKENYLNDEEKLERDSVLLSEDEVETSEGKSREERLDMFIDTLNPEGKSLFDDVDSEEDEYGCHDLTLREFASQILDMKETDGFDVQDYSKVNAGMMLCCYDPPTRIPYEETVAEITECACLAIDLYNKREEKHYGSVHVVKANVEPCYPHTYYITFEAYDQVDKITETFQARVNVSFPAAKGEVDHIREVELVRIKIPPKPILITRPRVAGRRDSTSSRQHFDNDNQVQGSDNEKTKDRMDGHNQ